MRTQTADGESCKEFDLVEMDVALKAMKTKGAPRKDDIPPPFLKNLGPVARQELLDLLNLSFTTSIVPSTWRHAVIIPLL